MRTPWPRKDYWIEADAITVETTQQVYSKVIRDDLDKPGFCIVRLPGSITSLQLREQMVTLKTSLCEMFYSRRKATLHYLSLGRFDQQTTTKLHLDGAPDQSILMLGYEPTLVASELLIADYSACAEAQALAPAEFLQQHNPMFAVGADMLRRYTTIISDWSEHHPRIVVINNSSNAPDNPHYMPGVLHGARILTPDKSQRRIINSTMLGVSVAGATESSAAIQEFLTTSMIAGVI